MYFPLSANLLFPSAISDFAALWLIDGANRQPEPDRLIFIARLCSGQGRLGSGNQTPVKVERERERGRERERERGKSLQSSHKYCNLSCRVSLEYEIDTRSKQVCPSTLQSPLSPFPFYRRKLRFFSPPPAHAIYPEPPSCCPDPITKLSFRLSAPAWPF